MRNTLPVHVVLAWLVYTAVFRGAKDTPGVAAQHTRRIDAGRAHHERHPGIGQHQHEEARYLIGKGIEVEIIPGITSAIAAAESFGIPLTIKNWISSVAILTGRKKDITAKIDAPSCGTLIYLMAVANIANVVKALRRSKRNEDTPCAFIEKASRKDSRIVYATIKTIEGKARKFNVRPPAVLVVGEVVKRGKRI